MSAETERNTSRAFLIAVVFFAVLFIGGIIYITVASERSEPTPAATPAPERLESSPTSPGGEALPPNRP